MVAVVAVIDWPSDNNNKRSHPGVIARVQTAVQLESMNALRTTFKPKKLCSWLAAGSLLFFHSAVNVVASESGFRDPREFFFTQSFGDLPEELQTARTQGKLGMLLFFEADGCRYCAAMLKGVLSDKKTQDWYRDKFVSIAIDIHGDVDITDFDGITLPEKVIAEHRKVILTPTVSFIDLDGAEVFRHVGLVKTVDEFVAMGEYVAGKHYFDKEFSVYASSRGVRIPADKLVTPADESPK